MPSFSILRTSKLILLILSLYDVVTSPFGLLLAVSLAGFGGLSPALFFEKAQSWLFSLALIRIVYFVSVIYLFKNKTWALYSCSAIVAFDLVSQGYIFSGVSNLPSDISLITILLLRLVLAPLAVIYLWAKRKSFN